MNDSSYAIRVGFRREGRWLLGELGAGRGVHLDEFALCSQQIGTLPVLAADLLRVACAIYAVDRLVRRRAGRRTGTRDITLEISVAEPDFWRDSAMTDRIRETVELLSDDVWEFDFVASKIKPAPQCWFDWDSCPTLSLYSGGLDSAAGLATRLRSFAGTMITVTAWHQARQLRRVQEQVLRLRQRYEARVNPIIVKVAMVKPPPLRSQELTQRCRSFLFASLGAAVAAALRSTTIEVYENGIGAINLPLLRGMATCSRTTRSSHPRFLELMSQIATYVANRSVQFKLPHLDRTKGELVRTLAADGLADVAASTVSCVHYPVRDRANQCGHCAACVGRRQAMLVAGIHEPPGTYSVDLFAARSALNQLPAHQVRFLKAMVIQADLLGELRCSVLPDWFRRYVLGTGVASSDDMLSRLVDVHLRYRAEWLELAEFGRAEGWNWAKWLSQEPAA